MWSKFDIITTVNLKDSNLLNNFKLEYNIKIINYNYFKIIDFLNIKSVQEIY